MSDVQKHDEVQGQILHEYDGIEEADNKLPLWWLITFYGSIVFAILYWFYYEAYEIGDQPLQAYNAQMKEAAGAGGEVSDELLEMAAKDEAAVSAGKTLFATHCVACHEAQGQGKIGPNLTDAYWVHGGSPTSIHKIVNEGVGAKGMPAWGAILGAEATQQVVAFVLTLRNTNVEGKEAEGDPWPADGAAAGEGEAVGEGEEAAEGTEGDANDSPDAPADPAQVPQNNADPDTAVAPQQNSATKLGETNDGQN